MIDHAGFGIDGPRVGLNQAERLVFVGNIVAQPVEIDQFFVIEPAAWIRRVCIFGLDDGCIPGYLIIIAGIAGMM